MPNDNAACVLVLCVEYCKQGINSSYQHVQEMKLLLFEYQMRLQVRHYSTLLVTMDTLAVYWFALVPLPPLPSLTLPPIILYTHIQ